MAKEEKQKNPSAQELLSWDKTFVWHPFTQMQGWLDDPQIVIDHGEGNELIDCNGKRYLDAISSLWVTVHGHNHPHLNQAIKAQIEKISHSTLLGLANVPSVMLAKQLIERAPKGLKKVFYSDNGSTAVEVALKMAFQYWQQRREDKTVLQPKEKTKFLALGEAYHGDTIGSVSVGGIELFHQLYRPLLFETRHIPSPFIVARQEGISLEEGGKRALATAAELLRNHAHETAALIIEPLMQGAAGMLLQPRGFVRRLAELCREHNVLLIVDEVATGFGRTGKLFACEWEEVTPDFLCLAKGISGGYLPLAATLTRDEIYNGFLGEHSALKTFFHGHTYTGNPLACAAALASLELFDEEGFWPRLQEKIHQLTRGLTEIRDMAHVGSVRQCGLMIGIELVHSKNPLSPLDFAKRTGHRVCMAARPRGLMMRPLGDVLVLMPPLSITRDEIDRMLAVVKNSIIEVLG